MTQERRQPTVQSLEARSAKITATIDRLSQFPKVGSETLIDRHTSGLNGAEFLSKVVRMYEPDEVISKTKIKIDEKTIPALSRIQNEVEASITRAQEPARNLSRIQELAQNGHLPEAYLQKAQEQYQSIFETPKAVESSTSEPVVEENRSVEPSSLPKAYQRPDLVLKLM